MCGMWETYIALGDSLVEIYKVEVPGQKYTFSNGAMKFSILL